uniref:Putative secreted protein n=1 Tax=Ixodes ricinus TaxID=34613 RepID=A0A6B0UG28_IXORI
MPLSVLSLGTSVFGDAGTAGVGAPEDPPLPTGFGFVGTHSKSCQISFKIDRVSSSGSMGGRLDFASFSESGFTASSFNRDEQPAEKFRRGKVKFIERSQV